MVRQRKPLAPVRNPAAAVSVSAANAGSNVSPFVMDDSMIEASLPLVAAGRHPPARSVGSQEEWPPNGATRTTLNTNPCVGLFSGELCRDVQPQQQSNAVVQQVGNKRQASAPPPAEEAAPPATKYVKKGKKHRLGPRTRVFSIRSEASVPLLTARVHCESVGIAGPVGTSVTLDGDAASLTLHQYAARKTLPLTSAAFGDSVVVPLGRTVQLSESTLRALVDLLLQKEGPLTIASSVTGTTAELRIGWLLSSMPKSEDEVRPNKNVQVLMYGLFAHDEGLSPSVLPGATEPLEAPVFDPAALYNMLKPVPVGKVGHRIDGIVTSLREYQREAVAWMVRRETTDGSSQTECEQWWKIPSSDGDHGQQLWYNQFVGAVTNCKQLTLKADTLKGGILAEEMGLGKTLEVMSLIRANMNTSLSADLKTFASYLTDQVKANKSVTAPCMQNEVACYCRGERTKEQLKMGMSQCARCSTSQHNSCMGLPVNAEQGDLPYLCPTCARLESTGALPSRATLIITPAAIQGQWHQEFLKHSDPRNPLKIAIYDGISCVSSYLQGQTPKTPEPYLARAEHFLDYDIVLTTYAALRSDLYHAKTNEREHHLRKGKKRCARVLPTPLLAVKWWRVCMDEAQMVGTGTQMAAEMAIQLPAVHRWCVTGTPIQRKGVEDLRGLMHFLQLPLYGDGYWFRKCIALPSHMGEIEFSMHFLSKVLSGVFWRNSKADVDGQLLLPPQTDITHKLRFAPVEAYFYKKQHEECSVKTRELLAGPVHAHDRSAPLAGGNRDIDKLLLSVLKLRQACCHPQVAGKVLRTANHSQTISMEELLESMILKATVECEEVQRQWVCSMCGLAALHIVDQQELDRQQALRNSSWTDSSSAIAAAMIYQEILSVSGKHSDTIRLDTVQRLHVMYNLAVLFGQLPDPAEVYSATHAPKVRAAVGRTLRNSQLLEETCKLRAKYARKEHTQYLAAQQLLTVATAKVTEGLQVDEYSEETRSWWESPVFMYGSDAVLSDDVLESFIHKLKDDLREQRSLLTDTTALARERRLENSLANRFQNADQLRLLLAVETLTIFEEREQVVEFLHSLKPSGDPQELRQQVLDVLSCRCHKRTRSESSSEDVEAHSNAYSCKHCQSLRMQVQFERLLYHDSSANRVEDTEAAGEAQAELLGSKHDSEFVFILKELSRFCSSQSRSLAADVEFSAEAARCKLELDIVVAVIKRDLELIELIRRELRAVRKLWQIQRHQFLVADELDQATTRLRLALPYEIEAGIPDAERNYKILRHQLPQLRHRYANERTLFATDLEKHKGQLKYLLNLQSRKAKSTPASSSGSPTAEDDDDDVQMLEASGSTSGVDCASGTQGYAMDESTDDGEDETVANSIRTAAVEECVICTEPLKQDQVCVLACGHEYCCDCITDLIIRTKPSSIIRCPTCRYRMNVDEVSFVMDQSDASLMMAGMDHHDIALLKQVADIVVEGSWGTKVESIVRRIVWLLSREEAGEGDTELTPGGKIIIFSQWDLVLRIISKALKANNIQHSVMIGSRQANQRALSTFKTLPSMRVLLLPVKSGSNGLNLIEATHVFLAEPLLNPAAEAQAIGRIHRIGQTRRTFVHRFVVQNTVEESIAKLMAKKKEQRGASPVDGDTSGWGAQKTERDVLTAADLWECFGLE